MGIMPSIVYLGRTVNELMIDVLSDCIHSTTLYVTPCIISDKQYNKKIKIKKNNKIKWIFLSELLIQHTNISNKIHLVPLKAVALKLC